jgi:hypothetical protein
VEVNRPLSKKVSWTSFSLAVMFNLLMRALFKLAMLYSKMGVFILILVIHVFYMTFVRACLSGWLSATT